MKLMARPAALRRARDRYVGGQLERISDGWKRRHMLVEAFERGWFEAAGYEIVNSIDAMIVRVRPLKEEEKSNAV